MRLNARLTGDRGKPQSKTSNDKLCVTFTEAYQDRFTVIFDGSQVQILNHKTAKIVIFDY